MNQVTFMVSVIIFPIEAFPDVRPEGQVVFGCTAARRAIKGSYFVSDVRYSFSMPHISVADTMTIVLSEPVPYGIALEIERQIQVFLDMVRALNETVPKPAPDSA